jgi:hypothetical protein
MSMSSPGVTSAASPVLPAVASLSASMIFASRYSAISRPLTLIGFSLSFGRFEEEGEGADRYQPAPSVIG